jgi:hypothetical protein
MAMIDAEGLVRLLLADRALAILPLEHALVIFQGHPVLGLEPALARLSPATSTFLVLVFGVGIPLVTPAFADLRPVGRVVCAFGCKRSRAKLRVFCISLPPPFVTRRHCDAARPNAVPGTFQFELAASLPAPRRQAISSRRAGWCPAPLPGRRACKEAARSGREAAPPCREQVRLRSRRSARELPQPPSRRVGERAAFTRTFGSCPNHR